MSGNRTIQVVNASIRFPVRRGLVGRTREYVHAVENVSLDMFENETVALVGESGSGKTTLGLSVLGLRPLSSGTVTWRGRPLGDISREETLRFRRDVQVVFQDPYASLNPRQTVREALRRPLRIHKTVAPEDADAYIEDLIDRVGLRPAHLYLDRYPTSSAAANANALPLPARLSSPRAFSSPTSPSPPSTSRYALRC